MALNTVLCRLLALTCVLSVWSDATNAWPMAEEGYDNDNSVDIGPQDEKDVPFLSDLAFNGFNRSQQLTHVKDKTDLLKQCGVVYQGPKIVGGEEIEKYTWNFLVLINYNYSSGWSLRCGGTILDPLTIVSAGHCYEGVEPSELQVVAGEHDFTVTEGNEQIRSVKEIIRHPDYTNGVLRNDVTVLKLSEPLTFNDYAQPMKLNTDRQCPQNGDMCRTAGWGRISYPGDASPVPLQIDVPAARPITCSNIYFYFHRSDQLCIGGEGKESCHGDSGGPMLCDCGGWKLAGITSYGNPCGHVGYPTVYAKVSKFHRWIAKQMSA